MYISRSVEQLSTESLRMSENESITVQYGISILKLKYRSVSCWFPRWQQHYDWTLANCCKMNLHSNMILTGNENGSSILEFNMLGSTCLY